MKKVVFCLLVFFCALTAPASAQRIWILEGEAPCDGCLPDFNYSNEKALSQAEYFQKMLVFYEYGKYIPKTEDEILDSLTQRTIALYQQLVSRIDKDIEFEEWVQDSEEIKRDPDFKNLFEYKEEVPFIGQPIFFLDESRAFSVPFVTIVTRNQKRYTYHITINGVYSWKDNEHWTHTEGEYINKHTISAYLKGVNMALEYIITNGAG